jgi:hypothetical protein
MAIDRFTDFVVIDIAGAYSDVDVSVAISIGAVSILPTEFPFYLVWWDAVTYTTPTADANREIVKVTAIVGTDLTIVRGQKNTIAVAHAVNAKMLLALFADQISPAYGPYHRYNAAGELQFLNVTTGKYYSLYIQGAEGDEQIYLGAPEA